METKNALSDSLTFRQEITRILKENFSCNDSSVVNDIVSAVIDRIPFPMYKGTFLSECEIHGVEEYNKLIAELNKIFKQELPKRQKLKNNNRTSIL